MSNQPKNPPAFPVPYSTDEHEKPCNATISAPGMSLRDYFAGQALTKILHLIPESDSGLCFLEAAADAYGLADAMLAEREKHL